MSSIEIQCHKGFHLKPKAAKFHHLLLIYNGGGGGGGGGDMTED